MNELASLLDLRPLTKRRPSRHNYTLLLGELLRAPDGSRQEALVAIFMHRGQKALVHIHSLRAWDDLWELTDGFQNVTFWADADYYRGA